VAVAAGLVAAQPHVLESLFDHPSRGSVRNGTRGDDGRADRDDVATHGERLTVREIDVLGELARGVPNKTIAARLRISEHTVKFHVASIFAKLAVASRTEAVTQGVRLGLIML
jgi:DNA-binding NarL/FixJ family response regulator